MYFFRCNSAQLPRLKCLLTCIWLVTSLNLSFGQSLANVANSSINPLYNELNLGIISNNIAAVSPTS